MEKFTLFCSPIYQYELDEHPQVKKEILKNACEFIVNNADITLYDLGPSKKVIIRKCGENEVVFASKAHFLKNSYIVAENYEMTYILKELELLHCIFEDMGAKEIVLSSSLGVLLQENEKQFGGITIDTSTANSDPTQNVHIKAGSSFEATKETEVDTKRQKAIKLVCSGKRRTKDQLKAYIEKKQINIDGFDSSVAKAIVDYLLYEEVNKKEIEITCSFDEYHQEKKRLIASIDCNVNVGVNLSVFSEIRGQVDRLRHEKKECKYSYRVIF